MEQKILNELKEIMFDYLGDDEIEISKDSVLSEDIGLSSLDMLSIVGEVEDKYGVEFDDDSLRSLKTVDDVIQFIIKNKGEQKI